MDISNKAQWKLCIDSTGSVENILKSAGEAFKLIE